MKLVQTVQKVLAAAIISMLLAPSVSLAFSTSATSGSSASGWTNSTNAFSSNNQYATRTISSNGGVTPELLVSGFNFAVPANAIIKGFEVVIERSVNTAAVTFGDNSVRLMKALSAIGTNNASVDVWPDSDASKTYGNSTNMWGTTWTPSEVNSAGFGLALAADCGLCGISSRTARVDNITINAFYTLPQIIIPTVIPAKTYGDADFDPAYTGGASGNPVTYSSTTAAVCTVVANQIHIVSAGNCTFNANQAGTSGNYEAATQVGTTITIAPKALTVTGVTAVDKIYDDTTAATLSIGSAIVSGRVGSDNAASVNITLTGASASFGDQHVDAGKAVTISALPLTGSKAASYTLPLANINAVTASIAARPLTVAAQTASKTYDGNNTSVVVPVVSVGTVQGDDVVIGAFSQTFNTPSASAVAGDKALTATGVINDGNSGNNYTYTFTTATGTINKKTITEASFTNTDTEVYDPTNKREFDGTTNIANSAVKIASTDVISGDTANVVFAPISASFASSVVGPAVATIVINPVFIGSAADNYVLGADMGTPGYTATANATITDDTDPTVTITSGPTHNSSQNSTSATFEFTVSDAASSIAMTECKLDGGAYAACTSPVTYTGLSNGGHSFSVQATDTSTVPGPNTSTATSPDSQRTFTVDTVAPTLVSITSIATNPTNLNPIPFVVTFSEPVSGLDMPFDFSIGNGSVTSVSPAGPSAVYTINVEPSPSVSPGVLVTFAFDAGATIVDAVGNAFAGSASTLSRTYDSASPTLTKTAGPDDGGYSNSATTVFSFTAPGATFECNPDNTGYGVCTDSAGSHTMSGLSDGVHNFKVKATDAASNWTEMDINFTVDTNAPNVVDLATGSLVDPLFTNDNPITATVIFDEAVSGMDISDFVVTNGVLSNFVVVNPTEYTVDVTPVADGVITLDVPAGAAQDIASNFTDAAPQLIVNSDQTAATLIFNLEPAALTNDNTLDFDYTASDAFSGVDTCAVSVDGNPQIILPPPCSGIFVSSALSDGAHTVEFTVVDKAGNGMSVTKNVTVDTVLPMLLEVSPVPSPTFPADARPYTYESSEAGTAALGGSCSGSGSAFAGPNVIGMGVQPAGTYNCTIVVTDAAGNASLPLIMTPFEVKEVQSGNGPVTSGGASFPVAGNIQSGGGSGGSQGTTGIAVNIPTPSSPQGGDSTTGGSGVAVTNTGDLATNTPGTPTVAVTPTTGTGQAAGGTTPPKQAPKSVAKGVVQKGKSSPKTLGKSAPKAPAPAGKEPTPETQTASAAGSTGGFWSWLKGIIFGN